MPSRLVRLVLGAVVGLAVAGCAGLSGGGEGDYLVDSALTSYPVTFEQGQVFTDGMVFLQLDRKYVDMKDQVILESVELVDSEGFELEGSLVAGLDRDSGGVIHFVEGFPPTHPGLGTVTDVAGTRVPVESKGLEVLIGMRVTTPDLAVRYGLRINYRVADRSFHQTLGAAVLNCPSSMSEEDCSQVLDDFHGL